MDNKQQETVTEDQRQALLERRNRALGLGLFALVVLIGVVTYYRLSEMAA